ncbi:DNA translocase FtsK [Jeotgalibacillus sp. S-D1]|uniref:DNA translocase FtsK n=1 Tax=Jeotgalibacillus sp. S-D1 TaxID=2552189 RepID=UPI001059C536|nr:DNA translocase FtsK [Jeotgalibacillus sp. S-D1]TDL34282.1 DNA translocase FtsK [Jeotgalibacillus sp. S-D1]
MSWIKKVLALLQQEENQAATKRIAPKKIKLPQSAKKEIDTKMVYQYPKGSFRFPLIPDGRQERQNQDKKEKTGKRPQFSNRNTEYDYQYDPAKVVKKDSEKKFTPTEIPSPLYGYPKKAKQQKPQEIEFELPASKKQGIAPGVSIDKNPDAHKEAENRLQESENRSEERAKAETASSSESVIHLDQWSKQAKLKEQTQLREKTPEWKPVVLNNKSRSEDYKEHSHRIPETKAEEKRTYDEEDNEKVKKQKENHAPIIKQNNSEIEVNSIEPDSEKNIESGVDSQGLHPEETGLTDGDMTLKPFEEPVVLNEEKDIEAEEDKSNQNSSTEGASHTYDHKSSDESVQEPEAVKENKQPVQPVKKQKKAGHLPFNVMMLKQDKRKMSDRSRPVQSVRDHGSAPSSQREQKNPINISDTESEKKETDEAVVLPKAALEATETESSLPYYAFPSMNLLMPPVHAEVDQEWLDQQAELLDETLFSFNVNAKVKHVTQGPSVTRFELFPEKGVKVSKITSLTDDIKLSLAARDIRMEAPIPGKMAIGIEIPNPSSRPVALKEILDHKAFKESTATLPIALGLDIEGQPVVTDIGKMPHGLIAGATGSGKSVCINSILVSLLYHSSPEDLRLLLIDPKMVELAPYNHIPHLVSPVITDVKAATAALKWAVEEMERRYQLFAHAGVRDIGRYNQKAKEARQFNQKLPYLVIVIDELADLMMMSPADVEEAICRIAQKARACGIHLLIATQRPSVDVITGLIKANVPTRVAFSVSSQVDSRTIIDTSGADRLLGKGDMLFLGNGASKPVRLQGTFVSDDEIDAVVAHVRREREVNYLFHQEELLAKVEVQDEEDELLMDACQLVVNQGGASTSMLQRQFRIGYNRAARLIDLMEKQGWISEAKGSKPRDVLMTSEDLQTLQDTGTSQ